MKELRQYNRKYQLYNIREEEGEIRQKAGWRVREGNGSTYGQSIPYACIKMSQCNPLFYTISMY
jgi:hypothetical protein